MKIQLSRNDISAVFASPITRIVLQVGFALLIRYLRTLAHPTARIAYRMALALSVVDRATDVQSWLAKELPKLERELRKLSKTHGELEYAVIVIKKMRQSIQ